MKREPNLQNRYENIIASDLPFGCIGDGEKMKTHPATDTDSNDDVDLGQNYQNAVDCLIQCEFIIQSLQEQLASKDEQMANLEEKLVQMSLDLASCKTFQDEQSQQLNLLKRRIPSVSSSNSSTQRADKKKQEMVEVEGSADTVRAEMPSRLPSLIVDYPPARVTHRVRSERKVGRGARTALSRSWSNPREIVSRMADTMTWSKQESAAAISVSGSQYPEPGRRGFSLSVLRRSWGTADDISSSLKSSHNCFPTTLDDSQRSQNDNSAKDSICNGMSGDSSSHTTASKMTDRHPMSKIHHMNSNMKRSSELDNSHCATRRQSNEGHTRQSSLDDSSFTTRRLTGIGQFLLRNLSKKDLTAIETNNVTSGDNGGGDRTIARVKFDDRRKQVREAYQNDGVLGQRDTATGLMDDLISTHSSRSMISGVVFPVSSEDCLIGWLGEGARIESSSSRRCSNANAEWLDFG